MLKSFATWRCVCALSVCSLGCHEFQVPSGRLNLGSRAYDSGGHGSRVTAPGAATSRQLLATWHLCFYVFLKTPHVQAQMFAFAKTVQVSFQRATDPLHRQKTSCVALTLCSSIRLSSSSRLAAGASCSISSRSLSVLQPIWMMSPEYLSGSHQQARCVHKAEATKGMRHAGRWTSAMRVSRFSLREQSPVGPHETGSSAPTSKVKGRGGPEPGAPLSPPSRSGPASESTVTVRSRPQQRFTQAELKTVTESRSGSDSDDWARNHDDHRIAAPATPARTS